MNEIEPMEFVFNNGAKWVIRTAVEADAESLLDFVKEVTKDDQFFVLTGEDIARQDLTGRDKLRAANTKSPGLWGRGALIEVEKIFCRLREHLKFLRDFILEFFGVYASYICAFYDSISFDDANCRISIYRVILHQFHQRITV